MCNKVFSLIKSLRTIKGPTKSVLLMLATYGQHIFPSYDRLSDDSGFSVPTVKRCVKKLVDDGLLTILLRGNGICRRSNTYQINIEALEALIPVDKAVDNPVESKSLSITPIDKSIRETLLEVSERDAIININNNKNHIYENEQQDDFLNKELLKIKFLGSEKYIKALGSHTIYAQLRNIDEINAHRTEKGRKDLIIKKGPYLRSILNKLMNEKKYSQSM